MRRRVLAFVAATLSVCGGVANAASAATIQAVLRDDGTGLMITNSSNNPPGETWTWEVCTPDLLTCTPFGSGQTITTAGAPTDVVFRSTSSFGSVGLSPLWRGSVSPSTPPSVAGAVRANELVTPLPGTWNGGWEGDRFIRQLAACMSPDASDCITLTEEVHYSGCPNGAAVIDREFTGRYLRVAERDLGANPVFPAYGVGSPYGVAAWAAGPTVSTAIAGQIAAATGPRAAKCGPPPLVRASISKAGVAKVLCGFGCRATLIAHQGSRRAKVTRRIPSHMSIRPKQRRKLLMSLPQGKLDAMEPGRVRMTVRIEGRRVARRAITLG